MMMTSRYSSHHLLRSALCGVLVAMSLWAGPALPAMAQGAKPVSSSSQAETKVWPDVLVIDDFTSGLSQWENQGTGSLSITAGPSGQALQWTAPDDGIGRVVLRKLDRASIDFSQYDYLMLQLKVEGKKLWNINPIIQQPPLAHGYRAMYYSIDTLHPFNQWFTYVQDLRRWENAWVDSYGPDKQEFQLEIHQLAGPGQTKITIDRIWLVRSPVKMKPSYLGAWSRRSDGAQQVTFDIPLPNRMNHAVTIRPALEQNAQAESWQIDLNKEGLTIPAGQTGHLRFTATMPASRLKGASPYQGQVAKLQLRVDEHPDVLLTTDLALGTQPASVAHPLILTTPQKMQAFARAYADASARKTLDKSLLAIVNAAQKLKDYQPEYPPLAAHGLRTDPITGGKLVRIEVPNLPFNVYQDPISGRTYSGHMYDAGMLNWEGQHRRNANVAQQLAMAYLITGEVELARKAADILQAYITVYPKLPIVAPQQTSPVGFAASGSVRIGSTYMSERVWLTSLAIALDSIRPANVLTSEEIDQLRTQVFEPSASNMMDHKVGAMNLQWQIQSAALFAGLACESPLLVARAMHDSHGIHNLLQTGYLPSGQWWENPSYQNVTRLAAYPAIIAAVANGILPWDDQLKAILKSIYQLHGPDGNSPTLGTGGWTNYRSNDDAVLALSDWIDDPQLAWIVYNRKPSGQPYDVARFAAFRQGPAKIAKEQTTSPIAAQTVNLADYGGIALRLPETDHYAYFHYGRDLVHGHRNKLSINAYGQGQWYMRNVMGGYESNFANFLETIASATTVMVNGSNADTDTGELLFHKSVPGAELASAREIGAYKTVEHERSVVLTRHGLIVLDRLLADQRHRYDWLYHASYTQLAPAFEDRVSVDASPLGESKLYESLKPVGRVNQFNALHWKREKNSGLVQAFVSDGQMHLVQVDHTYRPHRSLVWRQDGSTVRFASVMVPYKGETPPGVKIEPLQVKDASGRPVDLKQGQAVRVTVNDETLIVLVNYTGQPLTAEDLTSSDRVAVKLQP